MIEPDLYLTFVLATALVILMPGPVVTLTIANSLAYGTRHGLLTVAGTTTGSAILMLIGGLGMASAFLLLAEWFEWIRWMGAGYLIYLGVRQWRAKPVALSEGNEGIHAGPRKSLFMQGFLIAITNPKTILFYAAFFPQFMDVTRDPGPQVFVLSVTFLGVAMLFDGSYALLSGRLRPYLLDLKGARLRNRITGSLLIGTGAALALIRKA